MTIKMYEKHSSSDIQDLLAEGLIEGDHVTLDFSDMLDIEESFLAEIFSSFPKSSDILRRIRVVNARRSIVKSLGMIINSKKRGNLK